MKTINKIQFLLTIFSALLIVNFSFSQIPLKNDIEEMKLYGNVKSIILNTYELSFKNGLLQKGKDPNHSIVVIL